MNFLSFYLLTAGIFFIVLLTAFLKDTSTSKRHALSWIIVLLGALFWGLALPLALIERSRKLFKPSMLSSR